MRPQSSRYSQPNGVLNHERPSVSRASSLARASSSTSKRANDAFKGAKQGDFKSVFMCIDMDCFLVSFSIQSKPHLKGKPIAVITHFEGERPAFGGLIGTRATAFNSRAEVASCNDEARACGIMNGMFLGEAQKRCADLEVVSYSFEEYQEVSKVLYDTLAEYTLSIEAVSCDELYADLTKLAREMSLHAIELSDVVASIRADIKERTKCPVSAGIGPHMLVARLATRKAKPDGQFIVRPEEVENFMRQQKIKDIPGVCSATLTKLEPFGIELCEELLCYSLSDLQKEFGAKTGQLLFNASRGKDERTIKDESIRKSTSCDVNDLARVGAVGGDGGGGAAVFTPELAAIILDLPAQFAAINSRLDAINGQLAAMRHEVAIGRNLARGDGRFRWQ